MSERVAIITGAGSGIGRAVAARLSRQSCSLGLTDIREDQLRLEADELATYADVVTVSGDIGEEATASQLISRVVGRFGRLDALINCAGITVDGDRGGIESVSVEDFDLVQRVNVRGTFLACKASIPHLSASRGAIVNVASVSALKGMASTAYPTSKAAVLGLTRSIAFQYASNGVRCNAILPGPVDTPMLDIANRKGVSLVGRPGVIEGPGTADEVAGLIVFLLSDDARMINGAMLSIDGGLANA
ncbi:SDR family NAD(P)-dependent oxidoreductase [Microbacterium rhizomatis]|uniref:SDR family oxidoreductase n=1 Tax=Microbacterium rhizomatis TaxID=1631477 RepID=A0A5J5IY60_9MICO|nr:SDR family oxidoreductase [Microbacterium rhizomatis]KAA9105916.1 SDR family oxidoreductase [Microbacterium rhizomatis]